uniref:Uncharacterized protein n=1 Tax=Rhizophora mucronata TaxID=61149 RepID=A0A2P2QUE0_RHIMU
MSFTLHILFFVFFKLVLKWTVEVLDRCLVRFWLWMSALLFLEYEY